MGYRAKITEMKEAGISDAEISKSFAAQLVSNGISIVDTNKWLKSEGLPSYAGMSSIGMPTDTETAIPSALTGAISPQEFIKSMTGQSPVEGGPEFALSTIGSIAAPEIATVRGLTGFGRVLYNALASGVGAGMGSTAGQYFSKGEASTKATAENLATGFLSDLIFGGLSKTPSGVAKTFLDTGIDAKALDLISEAEQRNIAINPSYFTEGNFAKLLQGISGLTYTGRAIQQHYQKDLISNVSEKANIMRKELSDKMGAEPGLSIGKLLDPDFEKTYDEYNSFVDSAALLTDDRIPLSKTKMTVLELQKRYGKSKIWPLLNIKEAADRALIRSLFERGTPEYSGSEVKYMVSKALKSAAWDKANPRTQEIRLAVKEALLADLGDITGLGDDIISAKQVADDIFKTIKEFYKTNFPASQITRTVDKGSKIKLYERNPEEVVKIISRTRDPRSIDSLKDFIIKQPAIRDESDDIISPDGETAWELLKYAYAHDIYDKSIVDTETGKKIFKPNTFYELVSSSEDQIKAIDQDLWKSLKKEADFYLKIAPEFESMTQSSMASALAIPGLVHTGLSFAAGPTIGFLAPIGIGAISAWSLMSPSSKNIIRKWLLTPRKYADSELVERMGKSIVWGGKTGAQAMMPDAEE